MYERLFLLLTYSFWYIFIFAVLGLESPKHQLFLSYLYHRIAKEG